VNLHFFSNLTQHPFDISILPNPTRHPLVPSPLPPLHPRIASPATATSAGTQTTSHLITKDLYGVVQSRTGRCGCRYMSNWVPACESGGTKGAVISKKLAAKYLPKGSFRFAECKNQIPNSDQLQCALLCSINTALRSSGRSLCLVSKTPAMK
jgi:hypothetical protein